MLTWTRTYTPKEVYKFKPLIPKGKKVIAFRPPVENEAIISAPYGGVMTVDEYDIRLMKNSPRLILADCEPEVDWWE